MRCLFWCVYVDVADLYDCLYFCRMLASVIYLLVCLSVCLFSCLSVLLLSFALYSEVQLEMPVVHAFVCVCVRCFVCLFVLVLFFVWWFACRSQACQQIEYQSSDYLLTSAQHELWTLVLQSRNVGARIASKTIAIPVTLATVPITAKAATMTLILYSTKGRRLVPDKN